MQIKAAFLKSQTYCQEDTYCYNILTFLLPVKTPTYGSVTKAMRKPATAYCTWQYRDNIRILTSEAPGWLVPPWLAPLHVPEPPPPAVLSPSLLLVSLFPFPLVPSVAFSAPAVQLSAVSGKKIKIL